MQGVWRGHTYMASLRTYVLLRVCYKWLVYSVLWGIGGAGVHIADIISVPICQSLYMADGPQMRQSSIICPIFAGNNSLTADVQVRFRKYHR